MPSSLQLEPQVGSLSPGKPKIECFPHAQRLLTMSTMPSFLQVEQQFAVLSPGKPKYGRLPHAQRLLLMSAMPSFLQLEQKVASCPQEAKPGRNQLKAMLEGELSFAREGDAKRLDHSAAGARMLGGSKKLTEMCGYRRQVREANIALKLPHPTQTHPAQPPLNSPRPCPRSVPSSSLPPRSPPQLSRQGAIPVLSRNVGMEMATRMTMAMEKQQDKK